MQRRITCIQLTSLRHQRARPTASRAILQASESATMNSAMPALWSTLNPKYVQVKSFSVLFLCPLLTIETHSECADFCVSCNTEKEGKCDWGQCASRYTRNDDKICIGKVKDALKTILPYVQSTECPDNCEMCEWSSELGKPLCLSGRCITRYGLTDSRETSKGT
jgi:hypothetical protein